MTDYSYTWDGIVTGDAVLAPYNATKWNTFLSAPFVSDTDGILVVPGYLNNLNIKVTGEDTYTALCIDSGAAYIKNILYISDSTTTFTIGAASEMNGATMYRYDSIILQVDYVAKTVRLAKLVGTESQFYPPTAPTLTQVEGVLWEAELARAYVNTPAATFVLTSGDVFDYRQFLDSNRQAPLPNLIRNSEFMAFSALNTVAVDAPEGWDKVGSPTAITSATMLTPMRRGRACQVTGGGISQIVTIDPAIPVVSVKGLIYVVSGSATVTLSAIRSNGVASVNSYTRVMRGVGLTEEFQGTYSFDEADVTQVTISIVSTGTDQFRLGQVILVNGYFAGNYRQCSEFIPLRYPLTDTSWDGDAKSDGTTTITLTSSFGGYTLLGTKAVVAQAMARDSGSAAAATCTMYFSHPLATGTTYGGVQLAKVPNDYYRSRQVIVPVDLDSGTSANAVRFNIVVDATGASTLDATVDLVGIIV